jgi:hypothetical protein
MIENTTPAGTGFPYRRVTTMAWRERGTVDAWCYRNLSDSGGHEIRMAAVARVGLFTAVVTDNPEDHALVTLTWG